MSEIKNYSLFDAPMAYTFDDFMLVPVQSTVRSRKDPDISVTTPGARLQMPIISSPMNTVTETDMLVTMSLQGGIGVLHRYMSIEDQLGIVDEVRKRLCGTISGDFEGFVAVGANGDIKERVGALWDAGVRRYCIDVANGHSEYCIDAVRYIKEAHSDAIVMAGNVCTCRGAYQLASAGADLIRVGVGPGSMCKTRLVTGHGVPQLTAIAECAKIKDITHDGFNSEGTADPAFPGAVIVADGGIRSSGDIVKSLAAGADIVMLGSLLAGTSDTPGDIHKDPDTGTLYKYYHGMACYSQDTEILTKGGWVSIKEINKNHEVATLNKNHELEYHTPLNIFSYDYSGDMISIQSKYIDLLITPNHRLYTKKRKSLNNYDLLEAKNLYGSEVSFKKSCEWIGSEVATFSIPKTTGKRKDRFYKGLNVPMEEWLDFFGFWLAEGSCGSSENYSISISNNDKNIIDHYSSLIDSWDIKSYVRKRNKNYEMTFSSVAINKYLRKFGKAHQKYIPLEIKDLSKKYLNILLNGIFLGDGCKSRDAIYTSSKKLRDDIWEIAFKTGKPASISINHKKGTRGTINGKRFIRKNAVWSIGRVHSTSKNTSISSKNWNMETYAGRVFCVEVPNHVLCVRRNNKHVWCGNSEEGRKSWFDRSKTAYVPEGESTRVPYKGDTTMVLEQLIGGIKTGMSYAGAHDLNQLRTNAQWVRVSPAGLIEGTPHGKR